MTDSVYFAARRRSEIGTSLVGRLQGLCGDDVNDNGVEYENAYRHYYGRDAGDGITSGVTRKGEQGELAAVRINASRALVKAFLAIVTGAKMSWRPTASKDAADAYAAQQLAMDVLEEAWKTRHLNRVVLRWAEQAIAFSQAYVFPEWDWSAGPPEAEMGGRWMKQGDITLHNVLPWDVKVDTTAKSAESLTWWFVRLYKNRFDLAAETRALIDGRKDKEARDAILSANAGETLRGSREVSTELVPVWYFFHKPTAALPFGRETVFLSSDVVLRDGKLGYDSVPLFRLAADEMADTPNAWTSFWDTLGVQELMDGIQTTLATIMTTLGNPVIAMEAGSEQDSNILASGFRPYLYPRGANPPQAIQMAQFPPDALKYSEQLQGAQRQLMGLNDVALGQPQTAQMNAQAFAVLASMAVQQASPFQSALTDAVGALGFNYLQTLCKRVAGERMLKLAGKKGLYRPRRYTGADLKPIEGVVVEVGNPMEQTPAGRMQMLDLYMKVPGAVVSPEQVQQVADTGRLEPAVRSARDEQQLIQYEYEELSSGRVPMVHSTQNHPLHYRENAGVLLSEEALKNPAVVNAVQAHLDEHYLEFFGLPPQADPLRLERQRFLLGQGPLPMLPPIGPGGPMPPPGEGGAPVDPALAQPEGMSPEMAAQSPVEQPPNPMTGAPFNMNAPPIA